MPHAANEVAPGSEGIAPPQSTRTVGSSASSARAPSFSNQKRSVREDDAKEFAREKWSWLEQVQSDEDVTSGAFELAFVIAGYVNSKTRLAWPRITTLARKTRVSEQMVRRQLKALEGRGHLQIEKTRGGRQSNGEPAGHVFSWVLCQANAMRAEPNTDHPACADPSTRNSGFGLTRNSNTSNPKPQSGVPETTVQPLFIYNKRRNKNSNKARASDARVGGFSQEVEGEWLEFWNCCHNQVGEDETKRAYLEARMEASADELREAMARHSSHERKHQTKFMTPTNWLNGRRWRDRRAGEESFPAERKVANAPTIWIEEGSPQFEAWRDFHQKNGGRLSPSGKLLAWDSHNHRRRGRLEPTEWPPGYTGRGESAE